MHRESFAFSTASIGLWQMPEKYGTQAEVMGHHPHTPGLVSPKPLAVGVADHRGEQPLTFT